MNDLVSVIENRTIPKNWNYEESIKKIKPLIYKWKNITIKILHELWIAHEILDKRGNPKEKGHLPSFKQYCQECMIDRKTAYRWLKRYDPELQQIKPIIDTSKLKLPKGKYFVVYADPPWQYDFSATNSRSIETHYPTLTSQEIIDYQDKSGKFMSDLFNKDSVLFLWATAPKLQEALKVIDGWGLQYKTHAIWNKEKIGMGYWFRGQHELLLVGTQGIVSAPKVESRVSSIFNEERNQQHSKKPSEGYKIIEGMFPVNINRPVHIELFQKIKRIGWNSYGYEV